MWGILSIPQPTQSAWQKLSDSTELELELGLEAIRTALLVQGHYRPSTKWAWTLTAWSWTPHFEISIL